MANKRGSSKKNKPSSSPDVVIADGEELVLHNRTLAAALAWLIPGAGHFYQQRYFKSTIFSISVVSTFAIGMFLSGGNCLYASWNGTEKRWQFFLQAGVGLPAIPAALQAYSSRNGGTPMLGENVLMGPQSTKDLDRWHGEYASGFDMGTLYTMVAGLLNILIIYDAYAGPLPPPSPRPKRDKEPKPSDGTSKDSS